MICPRCGSEIPNTSKFCGECGSPVSVEITETKSNSHNHNEAGYHTPGTKSRTVVSVPQEKNKMGCVTKIGIVLAILYTVFILIPMFFSSESQTTSIPSSSPETNLYDSPTLQNTVVYSDNGITVTTKNLSGTRSFDFEIDNNRDDDITYMVGGVAINHCMVYDLVFSQQITPGDKAVVKYDISRVNDYGISEVETIDLYLQFYDTSISKIDDPICHVETSAFKGSPIDYSFDSTLFYEDENLMAYTEAKGTRFKDINAIYKNNSDDILSVSVTDASINGIMVSQNILESSYILPHSCAYTGSSNGTVTLWSALDDEIEEKGLAPIEIISGKIYVSGTDSYKTDQITVFESAGHDD